MKNKLVTAFRVNTFPDDGDTDYTTTSTFYADGRIEHRTAGQRNGVAIVEKTELFQAESPLDLEGIAKAKVETGSKIILFE